MKKLLLISLLFATLCSSAQRYRNLYSAPRFVPIDTAALTPTIGRVTVNSDTALYLADGNKWNRIGGSVVNNVSTSDLRNYKTFRDSVIIANPTQPEQGTVADFINLNEGDLLYFPERFTVYPPIDGSTITSEAVYIVGDAPMLTESTPNEYGLSGGTVFSEISLEAENVKISDIGVFMFTDGDGIDITVPKPDKGAVAEVSNVKVVYSAGTTHTQHGFLIQNYDRFYLDKVQTYNTFMGIVVKAENGYINNSRVVKHTGMGVHLKSDVAFGTCANVVVSNTYTENPSNTNTDGFNILSFDANVDNIKLINCGTTNNYYGLKVIMSGTTATGMANILVDGFTVENAILRGLYIEKSLSNTNPVNNIRFKNVQLLNVRDKAVEITDQQNGVEFSNFYITCGAGTLEADKRDFFDIAGSVTNITINNIKMRDFFHGFDKDISINFRGPNTNSVGGLFDCNVRGGFPQSGLSFHTNTDGTVLEPTRNYLEKRSIIVYNATGTVTINGIKNRFDDDYPLDLVPLGWELVILCKGNHQYNIVNNYGNKLLLPSDPVGGQVASISAKGQSIITFIKDADVWLLKSIVEI